MLLLCIPLTLAWAWLSPVKEFPSKSNRANTSDDTSKTPAEVHPLPSRKDLQEVASRRLRDPLFDPPPQPVEKPKPPPPVVLPFKLVGTMIEPGQSLAVFHDRAGQVELRAEGETIDGTTNGPKVIRIGADSVDIEHHGKQIVLKVVEN